MLATRKLKFECKVGSAVRNHLSFQANAHHVLEIFRLSGPHAHVYLRIQNPFPLYLDASKERACCNLSLYTECIATKKAAKPVGPEV